MIVRQGQHVHVDFQADDQWYQAVILEVGDSEVMVQQIGTPRAEWVPIFRVRG